MSPDAERSSFSDDDTAEADSSEAEESPGMPAGDEDSPASAETVVLGEEEKAELLEKRQRQGLRSGTQLGPYEIREEIGRGGMGAVYKAYDGSLDRLVAIKVLPERYQNDPSFVERFKREARTAASLVHQNLVPIFAIGDEEGTTYFAMEFVEGISVADRLEEEGALPWPEAIRIILEAAEGLRVAARRDIIHRDIKPGNLLLSEEGTVKVADFGLAKSLEKSVGLTSTGVVLGTPLYMSPEQADGGRVDFRTDIYALGATLYHLLVGEPPYAGRSALTIAMKHAREPIPDPRNRKPDLPRRVSTVLQRMMAKTPDARYESYDALVADLKSLIPEGAETGEVAAPELQDGGRLAPAGFLRRMTAWFVDVLPFFLLAAAAKKKPPAVIWIVLAYLLARYLFESGTQRGTPGKRLLGIGLYPLGGGRLGRLRAILRLGPHLLLFGSVTLLFVFGPTLPRNPKVIASVVLIVLGLIPLLNPRRRGLQDALAATTVCRRGERSELPPLTRTERDPRFALALAIIPGAGQIYAGEYFKGLLVLGTCWLVIPYVWGFYDAYRSAKAANLIRYAESTLAERK